MKTQIRMPFGRYAGKSIKTLPLSYLRWLINLPSLPKDIREEAENKIKKSDFDSTDIQITRHAIDMFSKRFLDRWVNRNIGLGTFLAHFAMEAITNGKVIKDERDIDKGIAIFYDGIVWVLTWPAKSPEFKTLITVMYPNSSVLKVVKSTDK